MTFISITFRKIVFRPFKQATGCLFKGCDKIIHVISNHVWCHPDIISNQVLQVFSNFLLYFFDKSLMSRNAGKLKTYVFSYAVSNSQSRQLMPLRSLLARHRKLYFYLQIYSMFPTLPEVNIEYHILFENRIVNSKKCY